MDTTMLVGILALVLAIIVVAFKVLLKRDKRSTVLLVGACGSGKTVAFGQLVHGRYVQTVTSMKANEGKLSLGNNGKTSDGNNKRDVRVVDVPGHQRLRGMSVDANAADTRAIVFLVDSATVRRGVRTEAEFAYDLLSNPALRSASILFFCNKQDISFAAKTAEVQTLLEKEIGELRETRSGALQGTGGNDSSSAAEDAYLGRKGQEFQFEH
eukprot:UC1_evm1s970